MKLLTDSGIVNFMKRIYSAMAEDKIKFHLYHLVSQAE